MNLNLKKVTFVVAAFLIALIGAFMAWRHEGRLPVRAAGAVDNGQASPGPSANRYVGAYTVPLTTDGHATIGYSRVGEVLGSGISSSEKARALLAIFPQLPAPAQPAAAQHLVNLLPDSAYLSFACNLTNASASAEVRAVIYADLLQRPNTIKLPWLLAMARSPGISQSGAAVTLLQAVLREDHGTDWEIWADRIRVWLQAHPDAPETGVRR